jgi:hypothetical protein
VELKFHGYVYPISGVIITLFEELEDTGELVSGNRWAICLSMCEKNQYGDIYIRSVS